MIYNMKFKYDKIKLDEFEYEHPFIKINQKNIIQIIYTI